MFLKCNQTLCVTDHPRRLTTNKACHFDNACAERDAELHAAHLPEPKYQDPTLISTVFLTILRRLCSYCSPIRRISALVDQRSGPKYWALTMIRMNCAINSHCTHDHWYVSVSCRGVSVSPDTRVETGSAHSDTHHHPTLCPSFPQLSRQHHGSSPVLHIRLNDHLLPNVHLLSNPAPTTKLLPAPAVGLPKAPNLTFSTPTYLEAPVSCPPP